MACTGCHMAVQCCLCYCCTVLQSVTHSTAMNLQSQHPNSHVIHCERVCHDVSIIMLLIISHSEDSGYSIPILVCHSLCDTLLPCHSPPPLGIVLLLPVSVSSLTPVSALVLRERSMYTPLGKAASRNSNLKAGCNVGYRLMPRKLLKSPYNAPTF